MAVIVSYSDEVISTAEALTRLLTNLWEEPHSTLHLSTVYSSLTNVRTAITATCTAVGITVDKNTPLSKLITDFYVDTQSVTFTGWLSTFMEPLVQAWVFASSKQSLTSAEELMTEVFRVGAALSYTHDFLSNIDGMTHILNKEAISTVDKMKELHKEILSKLIDN